MHCEIAVIVASYNRPHLTLSCLHSLFRSAEASGKSIGVKLVDASTNPETEFFIRNSLPQVSITRVNESSFWAESMRTAWEEIQAWNYTYLMWLNDDVELVSEALYHLCEMAEGGGNHVIAVGATQSPSTGNMTYGGRKITSHLFPLHGPRLCPDGTSQVIHLFEGNIVLIPRTVDNQLGGFPEGYRHSMADTAFGLRATRRGIPILLSPIYLGLCEANPSAEAWRDPRVPARERWNQINSAKGRPASSWYRLCREIGTPTWPLYFIAGYLKVLIPFLVELITGVTARLFRRPEHPLGNDSPKPRE